MPIVDPNGLGVCQLRDGWGGRFSYPYRESYSIDYHVLVDQDDDGPASIYSQAESLAISNPPGNLPLLNQVYTTDRTTWPSTTGETSTLAVCHDVQITPYPERTTKEEADGHWPWLYSATFEQPDGRMPGGPQGQKNPLLRPILEWIEFEERERLLRYDNKGDLIKNTAGDQFFDPPVTRPYMVPIHIAVKNYGSIEEVARNVVTYVSSVNNAPWRGYGQYQCLMLPPNVSQPRIELNILYYRVEWRIAIQTQINKKFAKLVWQPESIVNAGFNWIDPADNKVKPIALKVEDENGEFTGKYTKPTGPIRLKDTTSTGGSKADFRPYTGPNGANEEDEFVHFFTWKEQDFNALLPTSPRFIDLLGVMQ